MYCVHLCPNPPQLPVAPEACQWLDVDNGKVLLIHGDCHVCKQPNTRLPHILSLDVVGNDVYEALKQWGVLPMDTMQQAMFKVAQDWSAAWP